MRLAASVIPAWRTIDQELRSIAKRRAGLDAEEARWLRDMQTEQLWRHLGMVSALDYMERVLGYTPKVARDRLRVANDLARLPLMTAAFADGKLCYAAVRELTRVAVPGTEQAWCDAANDKSVRQIEELVADRRMGDHPTTPPTPNVRRRTVTLDLSPESYARFEEKRRELATEHGGRLDDDALVTVLCDAPRGAPSDNGRAKYQVGTIVCIKCDQAWQDGGGKRLAVSAAARDRALCDAQHIGPIDGHAPRGAATQDVPPATRREVWARDGGKCQTPGCRSSVGCEIHHIESEPGKRTHDPSNLTIRCDACHRAIHEGRLRVTVAGTERHDTDVLTDIKLALRTLGWSSPIVARAIIEITPHVGPSATFEDLMRRALAACNGRP